MSVVGTFLMGCTVLLVVGCAGVRSGAPQDEEQGHTKTTKQDRSAGATSEEARCGGTRTIDLQGRTYTTNDVSGCPSKGGLLSGTDKADKLDGEDGDDEIHGLGAKDGIFGGLGSDVIYGEDGDDSLEGGAYGPYPDESSNDVLYGGPGKDYITDQDGGDDVLYGGDGNDYMYDEGGGEDILYGGDGDDVIDAFGFPRADRRRDKLYCGEGKDHYVAHKLDYVDSSCEVKDPPANL